MLHKDRKDEERFRQEKRLEREAERIKAEAKQRRMHVVKSLLLVMMFGLLCTGCGDKVPSTSGVGPLPTTRTTTEGVR